MLSDILSRLMTITYKNTGRVWSWIHLEITAFAAERNGEDLTGMSFY